MTILGIKSLLLSHFAKHDFFDPKCHVLSIEDKDTQSYHDEMLHVALGQLEEIGLIKKLVGAENPTWVLVLPLNLVPQAVYIERELATSIAACINHYNGLENLEGTCDPTKIDSADIDRLLDIIANWEDGQDYEISEDDGDGPSLGLGEYKPGVN